MGTLHTRTHMHKRQARERRASAIVSRSRSRLYVGIGGCIDVCQTTHTRTHTHLAAVKHTFEWRPSGRAADHGTPLIGAVLYELWLNGANSP